MDIIQGILKRSMFLPMLCPTGVLYGLPSKNSILTTTTTPLLTLLWNDSEPTDTELCDDLEPGPAPTELLLAGLCGRAMRMDRPRCQSSATLTERDVQEHKRLRLL